MRWLDDPQQATPVAYCECCGGEIYGEVERDMDGNLYCPECAKEQAEKIEKEETVISVLEEVDRELTKYLSDDLRDNIWNTLVNRFRVG